MVLNNFLRTAENPQSFGVSTFERGWKRNEPMNEHRIASRHRVLKSGTIEFGGGTIDCTVRNLSETGAALEVTSPIGIPPKFNLMVDGTRRPCRVVWRKVKRIGITFEQRP
jgi:PilZ domain